MSKWTDELFKTITSAPDPLDVVFMRIRDDYRRPVLYDPCVVMPVPFAPDIRLHDGLYWQFVNNEPIRVAEPGEVAKWKRGNE